MGIGLIHGADVTLNWDASATPQSGNAAPHRLGDVAIVGNNDDGFKYYVFVENDSGTDIEIGEVASAKTGTQFNVLQAPVDSNPLRVLGVAQTQLPDGRQGWVLFRGVGTILAGSVDLTVDVPFVVEAAGAVIDADETDATTNDAHLALGYPLAAITATETGSAVIDCGSR